MAPVFKTFTLGCKVNQYETAFLEEALEHTGWQKGPVQTPADLVIINTCAVTQQAVHQSRQAIRKAIRENPTARVVATGCYAQVAPGELARIEGLDLVAGNRLKAGLLDWISAHPRTGTCRVSVPDLEPGLPFDPMPVSRFSGRARAYLKIQDGCEAFCSYCIVPFGRGPYRSLPEAGVLAALAALAETGYREVVLTGIHLGKYGYGDARSPGLPGLLQSIGRERLPLRIRLSSLEPTEIGPDLIEMAGSEAWLCRHFHIPLQSGDAATLERMHRRYRPQDFARLVERIHSALPQAAIGVDVMAGFPGENEEAHQRTAGLLKDLPISYLHVFPFSRRQGTAAFDMTDQVHPAAIKERAARIRSLGERKRKDFYGRNVGDVLEVLAEGWHSETEKVMHGTSDNYVPVFFEGASGASGRLLAVKAERTAPKGLWGRVLERAGPG